MNPFVFRHGVAWLMFVAVGIFVSVSRLPLLGRLPTDMTWGKVCFLLMPVGFAAVIFRGFAVGSHAARWMNISKRMHPVLFYLTGTLYLMICGGLFYASRFTPGF